MRLKKRVPSGREKDQKAVEMLARLREEVYHENPSVARHAAFNLSWMQEDGFDILKEALFGTACRATKGAAAYGLRKMRGRMKKNGMALIEEGLRHSNEGTRQVCASAIAGQRSETASCSATSTKTAATRFAAATQAATKAEVQDF